MLTITVPSRKMFDEVNQIIIDTPEVKMQLEHSLISISKWESKWHIPFLTDKKRTPSEMIDYIKCMTINSNVPEWAYRILTPENIDEITTYIQDPMTATTISTAGDKRPRSRQIMTNEVIYSLMFELGIPVEMEKWHINRLLTLIRVCSIRQNPGKKMSKKDMASQNRSLNNARRSKLGSKG